MIKGIGIRKSRRLLNGKFRVVGDGKFRENLLRLAEELNLQDEVIFVGKVPNEEVQRYYSVIDFFPFPRLNFEVCRLVTPLKPYEAMAMGKPVGVSNIPALKEMVEDNHTGALFNTNDIESLIETLIDTEKHEYIRLIGYNWVRIHRSWEILSKYYNDVYESLMSTSYILNPANGGVRK